MGVSGGKDAESQYLAQSYAKILGISLRFAALNGMFTQ